MIVIFASVFFWIYSSYSGKIFGFPAPYISFLLLLAFINNFSFSFRLTKFSFVGLLPLSFFYLFSPFFSPFFFDSFKYLCGFICCILSLLLYQDICESPRKFKALSDYLEYLLYLGIFSSIIVFLFNGPPEINHSYILLYSDPNLVVFISIFLLYLFFLTHKYLSFLVVLSLSLFSESRTFFLYIAVISFVFFLYHFLPVLKKLRISSSSFFGLVFIIVLIILLPFTGVYDLLFTGITFLQATLQGDISILDFDLERFKLVQANFALLQATFPIPIPSGLLSYQLQLLPFAEFFEVRPARAHSFYISYLAEYGLFFLPLIFSMFANCIISYKYFKPHFFIILSTLFALIFQEFFLSPFVFIFLFANPKVYWSLYV